MYLKDKYYDGFCAAYLACALWASQDDDGEPMDALYDATDLSPEAVQSMQDDCRAFIDGNMADLVAIGFDPARAGHDFWLTRNGHGAGFWDRGYGDPGDRLTEACKPYGTSDLYIGDDGKIYVS
jgi:hypothetical protein